MEKKIKWESDLDSALARARSENKPMSGFRLNMGRVGGHNGQALIGYCDLQSKA